MAGSVGFAQWLILITRTQQGIQELFMGDGVGGCLLEAQLQTGHEAGEAESADGVNEVLSHQG